MKFFGVVLGLKNAQFVRGIDESKKKVSEFKAHATGAFGGLGAKLAGFFSAAAVGGFFKGIVDRADQIQDLSERFGVGTEELQKMGNVAEQNGSSMESVAQAFNKLSIAKDKALSGDQEMIDNFRELGVSMQDLQTMSPDQLMVKIGQGSLYASNLVAVLGKNAQELVPTLQQLESADVGGIISDEDVQRLAELKDQAAEVLRVLQSWGAAIATTFIGAIDSASETVSAFVDGIEAKLKGGEFWQTFRQSMQNNAEMVNPKAAAKKRKQRDPEAGQMIEDAKKGVNQSLAREKEAREKFEGAIDDQKFKGLQTFLDSRKRRAGMTGSEIAEARRDASRDRRATAKSEREFVKKFGKEALQEMKDRNDPVKQAEAAYKRAMAETESKLDKLNTTIEDRLKFPTN